MHGSTNVSKFSIESFGANGVSRLFDEKSGAIQARADQEIE